MGHSPALLRPDRPVSDTLGVTDGNSPPSRRTTQDPFHDPFQLIAVTWTGRSVVGVNVYSDSPRKTTFLIHIHFHGTFDTSPYVNRVTPQSYEWQSRPVMCPNTSTVPVRGERNVNKIFGEIVLCYSTWLPRSKVRDLRRLKSRRPSVKTFVPRLELRVSHSLRSTGVPETNEVQPRGCRSLRFVSPGNLRCGPSRVSYLAPYFHSSRNPLDTCHSSPTLPYTGSCRTNLNRSSRHFYPLRPGVWGVGKFFS